jgi:hypothetical protein
MKKAQPFILGIVIFFILLSFVFLIVTPSSPVFSMPSGFYEEPFELSILPTGHNETIHFTLDGSVPTLDSPIYEGPLLIKDRSNDPNVISAISTISYRPAEPKGNVFKITVIRARSFNNISKAPGPVVTHTYLVGSGIQDRYTLPIISLVVDPEDFFDQEKGIYVTGESAQKVAADGEDFYFWPANYHERGEDWERPIYFEFFDLEGNLAFYQNAGVRIHGYASRSFRQKSLRLYASIEYDDLGTFNYPFFPDLMNVRGDGPVDTFETLILRNGGTDFGSSFFRDVLIQRLVNHTSLDTQAIRPAVVFLNGEYWGLYFMYERYDEGYFYNHYDIRAENIIMLEDQGDLVIGAEKERALYQNLLDYVRTHDLSDPEVYEEIKKQIDIENFVDYQITELFIAHQDWPENNIKYWRTRTGQDGSDSSSVQDGRWRWLLFDTDHGFIYHDMNSLQYATRDDLPTDLLRALLKNSEFRVLFLNRFADHLNTSFREERVLEEIDRIEAVLEPEMQEQIDRWHSSGNSMENWHNNVNLLRSFAHKRPDVIIQDLLDFFALDGTYQLTLISDANKGFLRVNSIDIAPTTPGITDPKFFQGTYFKGIPVFITAMPFEGYQFSHWEGLVGESALKSTIEILADEDIQLQPIFVPVE